VPPLPSPLAPTPPKRIRADIDKALRAMLEAPLAELDRSYGSRAQAGNEAISAYTGTYLDRIGTIPRVDYGAAKQEMASVNDALANYLNTQGQGRQAGLEQALAPIGADTASHFGGLAGGIGEGVANTQFARGFAGLENLNALGKSADRMDADLPGLAALEAVRSQRLLGSQLNRQLADERGRLTSQIPGTAADLINAALDREVQKGLGVAGLNLDYSQLGQQNQQFYAGLEADQANAQANAQADAAAKAEQEREDREAARRDAVKGRENEKASVLDEIFRRAKKAVTVVNVPADNRTYPPTPARREEKTRPYEQVFGELRSYVAERLRRFGVKDAEINRIVSEAMAQTGMWPNRAGLLPPGAAGQQTGPAPQTPGIGGGRGRGD
jgi:hypothetical protein